jgi:hypothetical protein
MSEMSGFYSRREPGGNRNCDLTVFSRLPLSPEVQSRGVHFWTPVGLQMLVIGDLGKCKFLKTFGRAAGI